MTEALELLRATRRKLALPSLRLGWNEGDAWTVGIGLVLSLALAVSTIPAVLDARNAAPRAAAPAPAGPAAPVAAGPDAAAPAAVALPPVVPPTQPLLGPLVPFESVTAPQEGFAPVGGPAPAGGPPAGAPPLAPGGVRSFAALPAGGLPGGVATSADGSVWAGTDAPPADGGPAQLHVWDSVGVLTGSAAVPDQPNERTRGVTALSELPDGSLLAVDAATSRVLRYLPATRSWSTLATVPDVPPCLVLTPAPCQPGVLDTPPLLRGLAVDAAGAAYAADAGQGTIWRVTPGKAAEAWYSSADLAGDDGVAGLAVGADSHLRAVVTRLADVQGAAAGALLRIDRAADGSAGARTVVSAFRAGEDPVDVALGASGNSYVALRGAHAVVTLDATGTEQLRVVDDALQQPTGLALVAGRLVVAAAAPRPAVLEIGVDDAPVVLPPSPSPSAGGTPRG